MRRGAVRFSSARISSSKTSISMMLLVLLTPMRSQKLRIAAGGTPRRRRPEIVGMRGSSHPCTWSSVTSCSSLRLLVSVQLSTSRANSYW